MDRSSNESQYRARPQWYSLNDVKSLICSVCDNIVCCANDLPRKGQGNEIAPSRTQSSRIATYLASFRSPQTPTPRHSSIPTAACQNRNDQIPSSELFPIPRLRRTLTSLAIFELEMEKALGKVGKSSEQEKQPILELSIPIGLH